VIDPEGREYIDCLSAYSAVNQGHCHPRIVGALVGQAQRCCLTSRAFVNDQFGPTCEYLSQTFGYEAVLMMNTGAEAVESALKIARRWGYEVKGIAPGEAVIVAAEQNFHGRTISIVTMSTDPDCRSGFGPFVPGFETVPYDDADALEELFKAKGENIAAFIVEPIQGEAGVYVPAEGYLRRVEALCREHNVLFIADEIQTGIARTGKMLAVDHEGVRPDIVTLGKAISGGTYPVSLVLADRAVMDVLTPGSHGSTFGGNPVACAVTRAALEVVKDEGLIARAAELGEYFRAQLNAIGSPVIKLVRGKGLLNAVVIEASELHGDQTALRVCYLMARDAQCAVLAKPTHDTIIRLAPPLTVDKADLDAIVATFARAVAAIGVTHPKDVPFVHQ
jgi:ornithine--oxo-acid transaminase